MRNFCGVMKAEVKYQWDVRNELVVKRRSEVRRCLRLGHKVEGEFCFVLEVEDSSECIYTGGWGEPKERE